MTNTKGKKGFGWIPDMPDFRDYTYKTGKIAPLVEKANLSDLSKRELPESVDLKKWCSPIDDQLSLNSCQSSAAVGLVEYFENRAFGKHIEASRLFLYKVARKLGHWEGDSGATPRSTMGALVLFGVPPDDYWPYTDDRPDFDVEPPAFCYAFAQNYQTIKYLSLDPPGIKREDLLHTVKCYLAEEIPSMFGFSVFKSFHTYGRSGIVPFPCPNEAHRPNEGHIVMAVGYDDKKKIRNPDCGKEYTGALLIRNSHGEDWGEEGYGWMPYEWILKGLARDWWTLLKSEWVDTDQFEV